MSRPHPFATRGGLRAVRPKQPTPPPPEPLPALPGTERLLRILYAAALGEWGGRLDPWSRAAYLESERLRAYLLYRYGSDAV